MSRTLPKDWKSRFDAETLSLARRIVRRVSGPGHTSFDVHDVARMLAAHAAKRAAAAEVPT